MAFEETMQRMERAVGRAERKLARCRHRNPARRAREAKAVLQDLRDKLAGLWAQADEEARAQPQEQVDAAEERIKRLSARLSEMNAKWGVRGAWR